MALDVARELAVLHAELASQRDEAPAVAAVARLATLVRELAASAVIDAATLPARDDRLVLEGLRAFVAPAADAAADSVAADDAIAARQCWFGVSAEDGLPWMYCANAGVARATIAALERLLAARATAPPTDARHRGGSAP